MESSPGGQTSPPGASQGSAGTAMNAIARSAARTARAIPSRRLAYTDMLSQNPWAPRPASAGIRPTRSAASPIAAPAARGPPRTPSCSGAGSGAAGWGGCGGGGGGGGRGGGAGGGGRGGGGGRAGGGGAGGVLGGADGRSRTNHRMIAGGRLARRLCSGGVCAAGCGGGGGAGGGGGGAGGGGAAGRRDLRRVRLRRGSRNLATGKLLYRLAPAGARSSLPGPSGDAGPGPLPPRVRHEVDDQRDPLEPVVVAQPVLEVVRPPPRDEPAVVHLDREPRRTPLHLRGVVDAEPLSPFRRWRAARHQIGHEPIELGGRDPGRAPVGELDRALQELRDVAARQR